MESLIFGGKTLLKGSKMKPKTVHSARLEKDSRIDLKPATAAFNTAAVQHEVRQHKFNSNRRQMVLEVCRHSLKIDDFKKANYLAPFEQVTAFVYLATNRMSRKKKEKKSTINEMIMF